MMSSVTQRRRIVILGGGPAGLSAALALTDPTLHPDALAAGASPAQFDAAATIARQNDALADLCTIAHVAARRSKDPTDQNRWQAMAVTALRAWGAEGVVTAYNSRRVTADE